ncbi:ABA4-like family protein [Tunicatimonas pelagia]|uniref:ABA4-like family protein n=1 Tax=Tunicatimonas pelagia TaxID=931531 RepID=UPI002665A7BB|nr:ABA4-like family protein [Tunicatimonas pelagia]WKN45179.1 ABA4-like family protein [Tunicatimonas pelagia]
MQPETIFSFANTFVLIGWVLLIVAFRWKYTLTLVRLGVVLLLSALYTILIITHLGDSEGGFGSLAEVSQLFENPWSLLAGWVHYLAFDLFVGSWEVENAQKLGISRWLIIPCLLFTFLLGPIGLLLYLILRTIYTKRLSHELA